MTRTRCNLCGGPTRIRSGYERLFSECLDCGFIIANDYDPERLSKGMGMEGSWTGPGGGGYREYYLVHMLAKDLDKKSFLLFGTGNTSTLENLRNEGIDAAGCDISPDVVEHKVKILGEGSFFTPEGLATERRFDVIVAVEVFEHFPEPRKSLDLLNHHLARAGIICGTTNFYPGGLLEDGNNPGYMSLASHVAYWSTRSMAFIATAYGMLLTEFEMMRPGSVEPDEKYGQLYPNKRVFFLYDAMMHREYFSRLKAATPILPIDNP